MAHHRAASGKVNSIGELNMFFGKRVELKRNGALYVNMVPVILETVSGKRAVLQDYCLSSARKARYNSSEERTIERTIEGHFSWWNETWAYSFQARMWGSTEEEVLGPLGGTVMVGALVYTFKHHKDDEIRVVEKRWDFDEYRSTKELKPFTVLEFSDRLRNYFLHRGLKTIQDVMLWRNDNFYNPPAEIGREGLNEIYSVIRKADLQFANL